MWWERPFWTTCLLNWHQSNQGFWLWSGMPFFVSVLFYGACACPKRSDCRGLCWKWLFCTAGWHCHTCTWWLADHGGSWTRLSCWHHFVFQVGSEACFHGYQPVSRKECQLDGFLSQPTVSPRWTGTFWLYCQCAPRAAVTVVSCIA